MAKKRAIPKDTELPYIIRDSREQQGKGYTWRAASTVAGTFVTKLDQGDYSIEGLEGIAAVERKGSASELLSNLLTNDRKRFNAALERLSTLKYKWVICDFELSDLIKAIKYIPKNKRRYFTEDKVIGSLASIMAKHSIPFIFAGEPRVVKLRSGGKKTICRGKDLTKKLLLKAYKYHEKGEEDNPNSYA